MEIIVEVMVFNTLLATTPTRYARKSRTNIEYLLLN
jgi:hypothetical protein